MRPLRELRIAATRLLATSLLAVLGFGTAAAQAPMPIQVPADVRSAEREQLLSRRSALITERDALRGEATRHNDACSAVTEGSAADAACIAAQQRLTDRIAAYRGDVDRFNAAVAGAPRRAAVVASAPRPGARTATSTSGQPDSRDAQKPPPESDGRFRTVSAGGDFSVTTPGGERLTAEQVQSRHLTTGTRIATGRDGTGQMTLPDGTQLELGPNSQLVLEIEGTPSQSTYDVVVGALRAISGRLQAGTARRWQVRTPNAIAGVRGTDFQATVEPSGAGSWRVNEGAIELRTPDGRVLALLGAGQQLTWDDSLRITSLAAAPVAVAPGPAADVRTRLTEPDLASWGRENGLLVAVAVLLGLVLINLFTGRRRAG